MPVLFRHHSRARPAPCTNDGGRSRPPRNRRKTADRIRQLTNGDPCRSGAVSSSMESNIRAGRYGCPEGAGRGLTGSRGCARCPSRQHRNSVSETSCCRPSVPDNPLFLLIGPRPLQTSRVAKFKSVAARIARHTDWSSTRYCVCPRCVATRLLTETAVAPGYSIRR